MVELGSHYGVSFFSFCEAANKLSAKTFVYAVDTWEDSQAGYYENNVYEVVKSHRDKHHKQRAELLRCQFDTATQYFNESIDVLHIDGLHTYEAVSNDYNNWKNKIKEDGIFYFTI